MSGLISTGLVQTSHIVIPIATPVGQSPPYTIELIADQMHNGILEFTGTVSINTSVQCPAIDGTQWLIFNNTTGAGTLTFQGDIGTGIGIPQGQRMIVYYDGTAMQSGVTVAGTGGGSNVLGDATATSLTTPQITGSGTGGSLSISGPVLGLRMGRLSKNMTSVGTPYSLTSLEYNNGIIEFVGTCENNSTIILPTADGEGWTVANNTTYDMAGHPADASNTITLQTAGGAGFMLGRGERCFAYCDGANIIRVPNAGSGGVVFPISVANGGTGATTAAAARANLGISGGGGTNQSGALSIDVSAQPANQTLVLNSTQYGNSFLEFTGTPAAPSGGTDTYHQEFTVGFPALQGYSWLVLNTLAVPMRLGGSISNYIELPAGQAVLIYYGADSLYHRATGTVVDGTMGAYDTINVREIIGTGTYSDSQPSLEISGRIVTDGVKALHYDYLLKTITADPTTLTTTESANRRLILTPSGFSAGVEPKVYLQPTIGGEWIVTNVASGTASTSGSANSIYTYTEGTGTVIEFYQLSGTNPIRIAPGATVTIGCDSTGIYRISPSTRSARQTGTPNKEFQSLGDKVVIGEVDSQTLVAQTVIGNSLNANSSVANGAHPSLQNLYWLLQDAMIGGKNYPLAVSPCHIAITNTSTSAQYTRTHSQLTASSPAGLYGGPLNAGHFDTTGVWVASPADIFALTQAAWTNPLIWVSGGLTAGSDDSGTSIKIPPTLILPGIIGSVWFVTCTVDPYLVIQADTSTNNVYVRVSYGESAIIICTENGLVSMSPSVLNSDTLVNLNATRSLSSLGFIRSFGSSFLDGPTYAGGPITGGLGALSFGKSYRNISPYTNSTVTLNNNEYSCKVIEFTGGPNSDTVFLLPTSDSAEWNIVNNTGLSYGTQQSFSLTSPALPPATYAANIQAFSSGNLSQQSFTRPDSVGFYPNEDSTSILTFEDTTDTNRPNASLDFDDLPRKIAGKLWTYDADGQTIYYTGSSFSRYSVRSSAATTLVICAQQKGGTWSGFKAKVTSGANPTIALYSFDEFGDRLIESAEYPTPGSFRLGYDPNGSFVGLKWWLVGGEPLTWQIIHAVDVEFPWLIYNKSGYVGVFPTTANFIVEPLDGDRMQLFNSLQNDISGAIAYSQNFDALAVGALPAELSQIYSDTVIHGGTYVVTSTDASIIDNSGNHYLSIAENASHGTLVYYNTSTFSGSTANASFSVDSVLLSSLNSSTILNGIYSIPFGVVIGSTINTNGFIGYLAQLTIKRFERYGNIDVSDGNQAYTMVVAFDVDLSVINISQGLVTLKSLSHVSNVTVLQDLSIPVLGNAYTIKIGYDSSTNTVMMRYWGGGSEPTNWQLTAVDTSVTLPGYSGVYIGKPSVDPTITLSGSMKVDLLSINSINVNAPSTPTSHTSPIGPVKMLAASVNTPTTQTPILPGRAANVSCYGPGITVDPVPQTTGVVSVTGTTYTVLPLDGTIEIDATSNNVVITLPAVSLYPSRNILFKRKDGSSNTVTITPAGSDTIDTNANITLAASQPSTSRPFYNLQSDGTNMWMIVGRG